MSKFNETTDPLNGRTIHARPVAIMPPGAALVPSSNSSIAVVDEIGKEVEARPIVFVGPRQPVLVDQQGRLTRPNGDLVAGGGSSRPKFRRRPTHLDGLAQGHTASSIWANDREVYVVRDISATGTTWERLPHVGGFSTDGLTGVQFAGGFFQVVRGYNGPAFDITVTTGGTPTTYTINIVDNRLDVETLEHRLSLADAGTFVPVRQLYDQSGAGNHAVKDSLTHDLFIDWDEVMQSWVLVGDFLSQTSQVAAGLRLPNTVVTGSRSASVAVVGRSTYGCDDGQGAFGLLGAARTDTISSTVMTTLRTGQHTKQSYASGALNGQRDLPLLVGQHPCVAVQTYGASNVELTINGAKVTGPHAPNAGNQLGGWIGTDNPANASSKFMWRMAGCIITNAVIPDAQVTRLTYGGCRDFNVRPQMTDSIYILADSRNANSARLMRNWPHLLANFADGEFRVLNMGVATQTTETMRTQQMPRILAQTSARPGARHVAVILSGINDFIVNSRTAEQAYGFLQETCANARANGCTHVIVVSELFTGNSAGGANTNLPALRTLIESRGPATLGADIIVSVSALPGVNQPANTTYYYDGTHITERIMSLIASAVWTAVLALP